MICGKKGREKKQLLPISSEPNESLEQPLLHIFSLLEMWGFLLFGRFTLIKSTHINGWKDQVFQTKTHISQGRTRAVTKQRQMLSSMCVCRHRSWHAFWQSGCHQHTRAPSQSEALRKTRLDSICESLINQPTSRNESIQYSPYQQSQRLI